MVYIKVVYKKNFTLDIKQFKNYFSVILLYDFVSLIKIPYYTKLSFICKKFNQANKNKQQFIIIFYVKNSKQPLLVYLC